MSSLFERLGATDGIKAIASDTVDFHLNNPRIAPRYADSDVASVKNAVATFLLPALVVRVSTKGKTC